MYYNINEKRKKLKNERMMNMTNLKGLFANNSNNNNSTEVINRGNQLSSTAELTKISTEIAREILKRAEADAEKYQQLILDSQKSHDVMDKLINEIYDLTTVDIEFLKAESEEVLDRMIKSQQSKRSRAKSKEMTLENYLAMLTGAVAENLLRIAANKPKSAGGGGARRGTVTYSEEELEAFKNDPEALRRALRNVQSKKSIYKSKADFDPKSERWQELLKAEEQLKAIRDGQTIEAEKAIEKTSQLEEMLATVDLNDLKAADAKNMLENIKQMLATK
jgi:acetolactate synthase regulatory subunit